ncbi:unnamed protein product [Debaryomyces tyrocola]|nr:unnamed protein product [Debaryomyces tyrocola]
MSALKLYSCTTPNGYKCSILLELLGIKYDCQYMDIFKNETKEEWFLELNPNGRVPTLVDSSAGVTISESGAILQYLVDTYDKEHKFSYEVGTKHYYHQLETLYFQMAGVGPMQGQVNHFLLYAPEKIEYSIKRFNDETKRLFSVIEEYLHRNKENGPYLVANHYCISDIAVYGWAKFLGRINIDIKQWPLTNEWFETLDDLPEVQRGLMIQKPFEKKE